MKKLLFVLGAAALWVWLGSDPYWEAKVRLVGIRGYGNNDQRWPLDR